MADAAAVDTRPRICSRTVLSVGDLIPDATVWTAPNQRASLHELVSEGRVLFLFYLFDWSST